MKRPLRGEIDGMRLNASAQEFQRGTGGPPGSSGTIQQGPLIEVSESDGTFNVSADFRAMQDTSSAEDMAVEFARQGVILAGGSVQRYVPLPTDAQIEHARVTIDAGIVRMSVPTADLGHRWRSLVMW
ncbi:MAG: hypothetical protein H8K10_07365 [Nitrospira sp.]|nr:hypothetical protein [Nitrospira sp.]